MLSLITGVLLLLLGWLRAIERGLASAPTAS
jgi:hypothetical protein